MIINTHLSIKRLQRSLRSVTVMSVGPADSRLWERKHSEGVPPNMQWATLSESFYPSSVYPWVLRTHGYRAVDAFSVFPIHPTLVDPWVLHPHVIDWRRLSPERALRTQAGVKRSETPVRNNRQQTKKVRQKS